MSYHTINNKNNNTSGTPAAPATPNVNAVSAQTAIENDIPDLLIDYDKLAKKGKLNKTLFRDKILENTILSLTTTKHPNALLVGDAGTGKTAIVKHLALQLHNKEAIPTEMLGDKTKIYELPLSSLVAGSSLFGSLEKKLNDVIDFASDPENHAILYIDEIHQLSTDQSLKNVSEILKPKLEDGSLHVIGSTTTQELKFLQNNPALMRRFSIQIVSEVSDEQTFEIVKLTIPSLQPKNMNISVTDEQIRAAIRVGNEFALSTHRPDSALTVIDKALSAAKLTQIKSKQLNMNLNLTPMITDEILKQVGNQLINNDSNNVTTHTVSELETTLDQNIVGQTTAKQKVVSAIKSIQRDLTPRKTPHSFMFAGFTGTGKTEMARQLALSLFGNQEQLLYLNMTEYASEASLTSLIGSTRGYVGSDSAQPLPLDKLKTNPMQIVLLDEFEKANDAIKRLFMQALDEGYITYADGSQLNFSKAIVIATTNSGVEKLVIPHVGFNGDKEKVSQTDLLSALEADFPIELLNRFEYVIPFDKLSKDQYAQIVSIQYNNLVKNIKSHRPELKISPETSTADMAFIQEIANDTYNAKENGRPAQKAVRHFIEDQFEANSGSASLTLKE